MDRVFWDENKSCTIDFSAAEWATDAIHDVFQAASCFLSSRFPHFRRRNSPSSSWENPHFQRALSGSMFHYCILPHEGVFHPVAPAASHQEMAVVGQPVKHGGCHLFIGNDAVHLPCARGRLFVWRSAGVC